MKKLCVFVFIVASAFARVAIQDEDVSNSITENTTKVTNKIIDNSIHVIPNKVSEHAIPDNAKKTCLNVLDIDDNKIDTEETQPCLDEDTIVNETALLLTPYIKNENFAEARAASKVDPERFLGFESYSGFLTVDEEYKSHLFFWYFPAPEPKPDRPWIIWLQGGPGASSMTGLFDEIGPFKVVKGELTRNPHSWLSNHSLVFIDNPVGTGFSFTEHPHGYVTDMDTYGKHLYSATQQLVKLYPELRTAPLYVAGESYAGKYVPALAVRIHRHKHEPGHYINLKGVIVGNAYIEPSMISQVVQPFYHFGLLEKEQLDNLQPLVEAFHNDIQYNRSEGAKTKWAQLIVLLITLANQNHAYNFLQDQLDVGQYATFLDKPATRRAIHVANLGFNFINVTVNLKLAPDFLSNTRPMFEELLEHYRVMAYCGQLDQMLPCAASSEVYRKWNWTASNDFLSAPRSSYLFDQKRAGYVKSGGGLTWAVVRGAGHMVPLDKPRVAMQLVAHFTHDQAMTTVTRHIFIKIRDEAVPVQNNTIVYL